MATGTTGKALEDSRPMTADDIKIEFAKRQNQKYPKKAEFNPDELEWIQLNQELSDSRMVGESSQDKLFRKLTDNPWIPAGCLLTTGFLIKGLFAFGRKDNAKSQFNMRGRILAQGFTIVGLMVGLVYNMRKEKAAKDASANPI